VPALQAQVLDIRAGRLRYPQPVQGKQGDQRVLKRRTEPGRDQQRAELVAVQRNRMGLVVHPQSADMRGRGALQELLFDGVLVEPGDGGQPPGDRGPGSPHGLQVPGEAFDVSASDREQRY
jgi:hypothetical protein